MACLGYVVRIGLSSLPRHRKRGRDGRLGHGTPAGRARAHHEVDVRAAADVVVGDVGLVPLAPVDIHAADVEVLGAPVLGRHAYRPSAREVHRHPLDRRRADVVDVARRRRRVESHGVEKIPRRHLSAVVVAAQRPRLVAVEGVRDAAHPLLALPRLAEVVVEVDDVVAGLVAVPVGADAPLDVVGARDVVGQLGHEERVEAPLVERAAHALDVARHVVGYVPRILQRESLRDVAPAVHRAGPLVGDRREGGAPASPAVAPAHEARLGVDQVAVRERAAQEVVAILLPAERTGRLGDAEVVVGVLEGLRHRLALLVERHPPQLGIISQTVVAGVGRRALHRLEGPLAVDARNLLDDHVGEHRHGVIADHAPGLVAVERPHGQHALRAAVGADLYAAEGHLRPGVDVAEAVGACERPHVVDLAIGGLRREGGRAAYRCQKSFHRGRVEVLVSGFKVRR